MLGHSLSPCTIHSTKKLVVTVCDNITLMLYCHLLYFLSNQGFLDVHFCQVYALSHVS